MLGFMKGADSPQTDYFKWQMDQCKEVKIKPLNEVLPVELFNCIRRDKIHKKGCYQSAYSIVTDSYNSDLRYVEGFGKLHGVDIQHAWVKYKDEYFDPIAWFIFNESTMILEEYDSIIELTWDELNKIVLKTRVYGPNIREYYNMFVINK